MKRPMTLRNRPPPLRRALSALLAALYLAAALGAARHAGEHDETGVEWLPKRFHHHHYELVEDETDAPAGLHELCVACQWTRSGDRLAAGAISTPDGGAILRGAILPSTLDARGGASLLPDSRGPPSA